MRGCHCALRAKAVVCLSNLHQWGIAWKMYTDSYDGQFTTASAG
ncbi:MAG: hypothetical protein ACYS76_13210 [Planctomycetota bacterium]